MVRGSEQLCNHRGFGRRVSKEHSVTGLDGAQFFVGVTSRFGVGGSVDTRHGVLPKFQLGKLTLDDLPANFFLSGSPVDAGLAGHIGMGTLRKFKVILDYSRRRMILEPAK